MHSGPAHVAHGATLYTIGTGLLTLLVKLEPVASFICCIVGIISGCFAIAYYRKGLRNETWPKG